MTRINKVWRHFSKNGCRQLPSIGLIVLLGCIVACGEAPRSASVNEESTYGADASDAEIVAVLGGKAISPTPYHEDAGSEFFGCQGEWARHRGRSITEGRYSVRNGSVCVTGDAHAELCRKFVSAGARDISMVSAEAGEAGVAQAYRTSPSAYFPGCGVSPIRESNLEALLRGASLMPAINAGDSGSSSEHFGCNGEWAGSDGRISNAGRYWVVVDRVCVRTQSSGDLFCRRFYRDDADRIYSHIAEGPSPKDGVLAEVVVSTQRDSCR